MVEYVCEGPDGYRPKMLQVPVRDAIRASAGGGFCEVYCGFGHVGCDRGWGSAETHRLGVIITTRRQHPPPAVRSGGHVSTAVEQHVVGPVSGGQGTEAHHPLLLLLERH